MAGDIIYSGGFPNDYKLIHYWRIVKQDEFYFYVENEKTDEVGRIDRYAVYWDKNEGLRVVFQSIRMLPNQKESQ